MVILLFSHSKRALPDQKGALFFLREIYFKCQMNLA